MTTLMLELEPELAEGLSRAAVERSTSVEELVRSAAWRLLADDDAEVDAPTPEEAASMRRSLEDVRAGRLTDTDDVFAKLDAKHGWLPPPPEVDVDRMVAEGIEDVRAGRVHSHEEVFAEVRERFRLK